MNIYNKYASNNFGGIWDIPKANKRPFYEISNASNSQGFNLSIYLDPLLVSNIENLNKSNMFLLDLFVHQRKAYRYYKALTELEEKEITEEEFDAIEDSCIINLKNESIETIKTKIDYLQKQLVAFYPEELEHLSINELADLLQVSPVNLNLYLRKNNG